MAFALLTIAGAASGAGLPAAIKKIFASLFENPQKYESQDVLLMASLLPLFFLIRGVFGFIGNFLMVRCCLDMSLDLRKDIFKRIQELHLGYFSQKNTGDLITRISADLAAVQDFVVISCRQIILQPLQSISAMAALGWIVIENQQAMFVLFYILTVPVFVIPVSIIARKLKKRGLEYMVRISSATQHVIENLGSLEEVRSYNLQEKQLSTYLRKVREMMTSQLKISKYELFQAPSMELIISFALAGALYSAQRNEVPLSTFLSLFAALYFAFDPIKQILKVVTQGSRCNGPAQRLEEILKAEVSLKDPADPLPLESVNGSIELQEVSFAYEEETVLQNISLKIDAGSFTALVGPSGGGKSTITKLLPRFYDPNSGVITLDGKDLRQMSQHELRNNIAIVSQRPVLFNDTVHNNILLGRPEATREEVLEASRAAHAHEFIENDLDNGYDTMVGERGSKLSGGQLQRIAIARAFLKSAPILILDEATSALDSQSEKLIQEAVQRLCHGRTVIAVAHRLSTIKSSDLIYFIDDGRVLDSGTHAELYERLDRYRGLVDLQGVKE